MRNTLLCVCVLYIYLSSLSLATKLCSSVFWCLVHGDTSEALIRVLRCIYYVFTSQSWAILHEMFTSFHVFCSIIARAVNASFSLPAWTQIGYFFNFPLAVQIRARIAFFDERNKKIRLWRFTLFTIHTRQYLRDDHLSPQRIFWWMLSKSN